MEKVAKQADWENFFLILPPRIGKEVDLNSVASIEIQQSGNKTNSYSDFILFYLIL